MGLSLAALQKSFHEAEAYDARMCLVPHTDGDGPRGSIWALQPVIFRPDIENFKGNGIELAEAIDKYYSNTHWFMPRLELTSSAIRHLGTDYADNARGIYYSNDLRGIDRSRMMYEKPTRFDWYYEKVLSSRNVFLPSFRNLDWSKAHEAERTFRASVASQHALRNSTWNKSEFAWDADARNDIFGKIKEDPILETDKHEYSDYVAETDPQTCLLTGEHVLKNRTPDATFGLAICHGGSENAAASFRGLCEEKLDRILLHPKIGLISDPRWGHNEMAFPWGVYEAKGWSGDYREARHQACTAGARYLAMLDHLARKPGPASARTRYQTERSHDYQIFVFTSIGSHWHVLVGCRNDRLPEQHVGTQGMSEAVSLFRKVWSGSISTQRGAWELLTLVDQIHEWAQSTFRDFVTRHLEAWNTYCDKNFLLDWKPDDENSKSLRSPKKPRELPLFTRDVGLPEWCNYVDFPLRQRMQDRARALLKESLKKKQEGEKTMDLIKDILPRSAKGCPVHRANMIHQDPSTYSAGRIRRQGRRKPKRAELKEQKWVVTPEPRLHEPKGVKLYEWIERRNEEMYRRCLRSVEKSD